MAQPQTGRLRVRLEGHQETGGPLAWICRKLELHEMRLVLANVLAIFAPVVAFLLAFLTSFVLVFLMLRVLLNVARDFAARPPWRRPPQRRWWPFYLLSPDKGLPWRSTCPARVASECRNFDNQFPA